MRLCTSKRERCIELYYSKNLQFEKQKINKLRLLLLKENIEISNTCLRNLITKFEKTGSVENSPSCTRGNAHSKVG